MCFRLLVHDGILGEKWAVWLGCDVACERKVTAAVSNSLVQDNARNMARNGEKGLQGFLNFLALSPKLVAQLLLFSPPFLANLETVN